MPDPSRKNDVDVEYRKNLAAFQQWEEQEVERQAQQIASARMAMRDRRAYFNPIRWLQERWRWLKWFSL